MERDPGRGHCGLRRGWSNAEHKGPGFTVEVLACSLIVGALIIGFSILMTTGLSAAEGVINRAVLLLAVASPFWFMVRFVRDWWRRRKADK